VGIVGERLLLTLWVGSLWAIGYIAVPLTFIHFDDNVIAGAFAGKLFTLVDYVGLACGTALVIRFAMLGQHVRVLWRFWVTLTMLVLVAFLHFYLQAEMADIKAVDWREDSILSGRFDVLHHVSTGIYMVLSVLGLALVATQDNTTVAAERA
tara:strand:- start:492 stop:947 length:456 start_codon:yes stop_codon:yes gene_type:complete